MQSQRSEHQESMNLEIFLHCGLYELSQLSSYSGLQHTKHIAILLFLSLPHFLFASKLFFFFFYFLFLAEGLLDQSRFLFYLAFQL